MDDLWPALALVLVVEGLVVAFLPRRLGDVLRYLDTLSAEQRRSLGLGAASLGALLYWLLR